MQRLIYRDDSYNNKNVPAAGRDILSVFVYVRDYLNCEQKINLYHTSIKMLTTDRCKLILRLTAEANSSNCTMRPKNG